MEEIERVDGAELSEPIEPGSDARLSADVMSRIRALPEDDNSYTRKERQTED